MIKFANRRSANDASGFSLVEMLVSMTVFLTLLALVSGLMYQSLSTRGRETRKTDGLTAAQTALGLISSEVANSGFGLTNNGLVTSDCNIQRLHFRTNVQNSDGTTNAPGEDIVYYYDSRSSSVVRYDRFGTPQTSVVLNRVSNVNFTYYDFSGSTSTPTESAVPSANTGRIRATVTVTLEPVSGQPNDSVTFTTDTALRNSPNQLSRY